MTIADLPAHMRGNVAFMMIMGITPGPKMPRHSNLHHFLAPLMFELREAWANGVWVETLKYPLGTASHVSGLNFQLTREYRSSRIRGRFIRCM